MRDSVEAWLRQTRDVLLGIAVVAFIAGCPGAVFFGVLGGACSWTKRDHAKHVDLPAIAQGLASFRARRGELPRTLEHLVAADVFEKLPMDPWGRPYQYEPVGATARIASLGRDGAFGGEGEDADLEEWLGR